jgi:dTDP-4-amino-4,6-dideoxygalactose transaminase
MDQRDRIMNFLYEQGIETRAYFYPPVHKQAFFQNFVDRALPCTERLSERVITLPFYTSITEAEMNYIIDALVEAQRRFL